MERNESGAAGGQAIRQAGSSPERQGGIGSWIAGVFMDPTRTFESIVGRTAEPHPTDPQRTVDRTKWWIPVIIAAVVGLAVALYTVPNIVMPQQAEVIRETVIERGGTAEQAEQAISMSSAVATPMAVVGAIVGTFVMFFVIAGILHLVAKMLGGKGAFRNGRAIVAYSMLVSALGSIVKLPLMVVRKTLFVETGPTLFFPNLEPSDRLYRVLTSFDFFNIWWIVLLIFGLAIAYRLPRVRVAVAVIVLWAVVAAVSSMLPAGGAFGVSG